MNAKNLLNCVTHSRAVENASTRSGLLLLTCTCLCMANLSFGQESASPGGNRNEVAYPLGAGDWVVSKSKWQPGADGNLRVEFAKEAQRLTSNPKFRYGILEMEVRFSRLDGVNYYLGFMSRDPWAENVVWLNNDGRDRFILRTAKQGKHADVPRSETPKIEPGSWHKLRIEWQQGAADRLERNPDRVRFYLNDKLLAEHQSLDSIPDKHIPVVFDAIPQGDVSGSLEIRNLRVFTSKESVRKEALLSAEAALPPVTKINPSPKPGPVSATIKDGMAELDNAFLRCRIDLKALRIVGLQNKFTGVQMLSEPSRIFLLNESGRDLAEPGYRLVEATPSNSSEGASVKVLWTNADAGVKALLTMRLAKDAAAVLCKLDFENVSAKAMTIGLTAPLLEHIQVSRRVEDDHCFFPFMTGVCGSLPLHLRHGYGYMAWMQLLSVFDPVKGGGVFVYPRDASGTPKVLVANKRHKSDEDPVVHTTGGFAEENPGEIFGEQPGTALAVRHLRRELKPGKSGDFPEWCMGVGGGDWRDGFEDYRQWVRSWFHKKFDTSRWFRDTYEYISQHPNGGNWPSPGGFMDESESRYVFSERMGPTEVGSMTEWAFWWEYPREYVSPGGGDFQTTQYREGDLFYNVRRGGLPAFREEIKRIHDKGARLQLYALSIGLSDASEIGKKHGAEWGRKMKNGQYSTDWVEPGKGYNACLYVKGWREHFSTRLAEVLRETGADSCRLDVAATFYQCFNPDHPHYDGSVLSSVSPPDMAEFLGLCSRRVREANPEAAVMVENCGTEHAAQFHDGYLTQLFNFNTAFMGPLRGMSRHNLIFLRFLLPEVKVYIFGYDHEDGGRRAFFNAAGQDRGGARGESLLQVQRMQTVLAENGDAVWGDQPEPLVPTLQEGLLANYFPGERKRIWTLWNRASKPIEGELISIAGRKDVPLAASVKGGRTVISGKLAPDEVVCIAELPKRLNVRRDDSVLRVEVRQAGGNHRLDLVSGRDEAKNTSRVALSKGKAQVKWPDAEKVVLKLFSDGYLLDQVVVSASNEK